VATERQVDDVVSFASILLGEYQAGSALHEVVDQALAEAGADYPFEGTFTVDVEAEGRDLAGLLAVFGGVKLAFEAAAVAAMYDGELPDHTPDSLDYGFLRKLAVEQHLTLEIIELSSGSFRGKLRAIFTSPVTYAIIAGAAAIATAAIAVAFPAVAIPGLIITIGASLLGVAGAILTQRAATAEQQGNAEDVERLRQQLQETQNQLGQAQRDGARDHELIQGLLATIDRLEEKIAALATTVVDLKAAAEARPQRIDVQVQA